MNSETNSHKNYRKNSWRINLNFSEALGEIFSDKLRMAVLKELQREFLEEL